MCVLCGEGAGGVGDWGECVPFGKGLTGWGIFLVGVQKSKSSTWGVKYQGREDFVFLRQCHLPFGKNLPIQGASVGSNCVLKGYKSAQLGHLLYSGCVWVPCKPKLPR